MRIKTTIKGLPEIRRALDALPAAVEKKVVDGALRKGGEIFKADIKAKAKFKRLRDGVAVKTASRTERQRDVNKGDVYVGFKGDAARFAHLPEFGTAERVQKTTGRRTGKMPMTPLVRPAFDSKKDAAADAVIDALAAGVEREASKLGKG